MKNIIKNNLKQRIWLTGCVTLLFILLRPMMQLMTYENEKRYALTPESLNSVMEKFFLPDIFTDYVPTAIACIVIAIVFFGYLFSKNQVDLYHSIPVDRKHLFLVNYLSGIAVYMFALIFEFIMCVLIAVPNHYMTGTSFKNMIAAICINLIHFLFGYAITICGIMLAGNMIVAVAGSAVIALIYPVSVSILQYFERYFFVTYLTYNKVKPVLLEKYSWLSPVTSYATIIQRTKYEWNDYFYSDLTKVYAALILPVIMTIIVTVIAYFLYNNRPSEAAGRAIAFKKSRVFIEVPLTILGGLIGAWFMSTSINTYKTSWIWTGLILGVILVHCVLEVIINESFKRIMSHKIQLVASLVISVIIVGVYFTDFTHYDRYIPDRKNVASAGIYFDGIDNNLSIIEAKKDPANPDYYTIEYQDGAGHAFANRFTDDALINKILEISEIGVESVDDMISAKYDNYDDSYLYRESAMEEKVVLADEEKNYLNALSDDEAYAQALNWMEENGIHLLNNESVRKIDLRICYELKNGKIVMRSYTIPLAKVLSEINDIYINEEYKKVHFNLLDSYEEEVYKVEVYDGFDGKAVSVTGEEKDILLKTYLSELNKLDIDTISRVPIGRMAPLVKVSEIFDETYSGYYLYPELTNTLALIESYGVDISSFTNEIKAEDLISLSMSSYSLYGYSDDNHLYVDNLTYDRENDEKYLHELAPMLLNSNNAWSNSLLISEKTNMDIIGVDMTANLTSVKGIQRFISVMFKDGNLPEKVNRDMVIRMWEENQ